MKSPIGVFDSGYGGLTVLRELVDQLPQYDYLYLGDNARSPYGNRSYETVYHYTLDAVKWLLKQNCPLVILACNTASAKALRSIQQNDLASLSPTARVLGVIRPTTEVIGHESLSGSIGIMATTGTVESQSYLIEIEKFFPELNVEQQACPMWVPLIENNEHTNPGADYFLEKNVNELLSKNKKIDTILLACTHYPLVKDRIRSYVPEEISIISQGEIVAKSLSDYLRRHPEIESSISQSSQKEFYTTDSIQGFDQKASLFFGEAVQSKHVDIQ